MTAVDIGVEKDDVDNVAELAKVSVNVDEASNAATDMAPDAADIAVDNADADISKAADDAAVPDAGFDAAAEAAAAAADKTDAADTPEIGSVSGEGRGSVDLEEAWLSVDAPPEVD